MSKTALIDAVRALDQAATKKILDARPDLTAVRDRQDRNLLQLACCIEPKKAGRSKAAQTKFAEYLLDLGFAIDEPVGKDKCTALFFAVARAQNPDLVKFLLRRGARVSAAPGGGLFASGWWDDVEMTGILLDAGADIEQVAGVTPFLASWCWKRFAAAKYFVERGADIDYQDRKGRTALHHSVEREFDPALIRWLVAHGASPDVHDREGVSPRLRASRKRDKRFIAAIEHASRE